MPAREFTCIVTETRWLTPSVLALRFETKGRGFEFEAGQFLSLIIPATPGLSLVAPTRGAPKRIRRIYSFACAPENGYELCVKITGGPGPSFLAGLKVGDRFQATAPYGDFTYQPKPGRGVCFISTGTGIAPFRAMIQSQAFQAEPPPHALSLFGARSEGDLLYEAEFHALGVETVFALTQPEPHWRGYRGRVTDYLRSLPAEFPWHTTEFYLCGNGAMVDEVREILSARGVLRDSIHGEIYFKDHAASESRANATVPLIDRLARTAKAG